jgi:hypothetical protein
VGKGNPTSGDEQTCQRHLARETGYEAGSNRTYLSKLEKRASYPALESIAKFATVLEVKPLSC